MRDLDFRACVWGLIVLLMGCTRWESFEVPGPAQALPSYLRVSAPGPGFHGVGAPLCAA